MNRLTKSISTYFVLAGFMLLHFGCNDFLDVNEDTDQPSFSTPNLLLTPIQGLMAINVYEQGETTAYFAQHLATLSGFSAVKDRWDYTQVTRVGLFRRHFHDVAGNARNLIETAKKEGSKNYEATGHIMMVLSTQTATDLFGQMPYHEALKGNPSPPYDDQNVIYDGMLLEIDEALELLQESDDSDRNMGSSEDNIYAGNLSSWNSFAHGLKARILLHSTPNINQNYQAIIDEVDLALAGWVDPLFQYDGSSTSAWEQNPWGEDHARPDWDYIPNILEKSAPSTFLLEDVLGYDPIVGTINDPRMPLMMQSNAANEYLSVVPSQGKENLRDDNEYPGLYNTYYTSNGSAMPYMTQEELYFIKAEAAFNNNNASEAYTSYLEGIRLHMERVGVGTADINSFMSGSMVAASSNDLKLSDIMIQKWLALYLRAEAWVDMRRYQYDTKIYIGLKKPENLAFFWTDDATEWIQRIPYDNQTEEIFNKPELERLGAFQNPDWLKVPLWWTGK